jgi:4-hydroxy-3-methylbut-2-enyl diphosphate reductase
LKLQNRVKSAYDKISEQKGQIVIFGQQGHAEVIGLSGQTNNEAIVITTEEDLDNIDFKRPVTLFSQTTKSTEKFYKMKSLIEERIKDAIGTEENFDYNDSICRQVSNREPQLRKFSHDHEVIVFVSGKKSSNGKALYGVCKAENDRSYFVENETEIDPSWFKPSDSVGICGATSTPMWLMQQVADFINGLKFE